LSCPKDRLALRVALFPRDESKPLSFGEAQPFERFKGGKKGFHGGLRVGGFRTCDAFSLKVCRDLIPLDYGVPAS
jgi:hypothetical protein